MTESIQCNGLKYAKISFCYKSNEIAYGSIYGNAGSRFEDASEREKESEQERAWMPENGLAALFHIQISVVTHTSWQKWQRIVESIEIHKWYFLWAFFCVGGDNQHIQSVTMRQILWCCKLIRPTWSDYIKIALINGNKFGSGKKIFMHRVLHVYELFA